MAIYVQSARMIIAEHRNRPIAGTVLLIGRQSVYLTEKTAMRLFEEEGITPNPGYFVEFDNSTVATAGSAFLTDRSFLSMLTDAKVIALDVSAYEDAEIVHDLNLPLPAEYENTADFIINGSCLDNLFDPATAIKSLSKMLRPGGRILSFELATQAYGAFCMYSPEWFFDFYAANNYEGCKIYIAHFDQDLNDDYDVYLWHPFYDRGGQLDQSPMRVDDGDFLLYVVAVKGADSTNDKTPIQAFYRMMQEPSANAHYLERAEYYKTSHPTITIPKVHAEPWNGNDLTWREAQYARTAGTSLRRWKGVSGRYLFRVGDRPREGKHFTFVGTLRNRQTWGAPFSRIHFAVPVWGEAYVKLFTEVSLPAQLSPGNIPVLSGAEGCHYHIFTTREDYDAIRQSPAFNRLATLIHASIHLIDPPATHDERYDKKSEVYRAAIRIAAQSDAANFFLNADIVLADGFVRRVTELLAEGKRVIELPGPRTAKDGLKDALLQYRDGSDAIVVPPRRLAALAIEHLHPLEQMHMWEEPGTDAGFHPSHLYWRVGTSSLAARCFHLYPIVVHPRDKAGAETFDTTIDDDLVERACPDPQDTHVVVDSDEMFCCEMSAADHFVGSMGRRGNIDDVAAFCVRYGKPRNAQLLEYRIRMVGGDEPAEAWSAAEAKAEAVVRQLVARLPFDRGTQAVTAASPALQAASVDGVVVELAGGPAPGASDAFLSDLSLSVREPVAGSPRHAAPPGEARAEPPLHVVVPVWGERHVKLFTELSLPSQLSPNNVPALVDRERCHYHIVTTQADYGAIFASPAFNALAALMHASIHVFEAPANNADASQRAAKREEARNAARQAASSGDGGLLLLGADLVVADGFLRSAQRLLAAGEQVTTLAGVRASRSDDLAERLQKFRAEGGEIVVSPAQLGELSLAAAG